jgi:hypothetical protein
LTKTTGRAGNRKEQFMHPARFGAGVLTGILCLTAAVGRGQPPNPELKVVNYAQLGELVAENRGKVVLIDLWQNG